MSLTRLRSGFTLVELMVVTGLMAAVLGLILAGTRPTGVTQVRELAQALSSTILATQTRAIGTEQGAALMLIPSAVIAGGVAADAVHFANILPVITGSVVQPSPPSPPPIAGPFSVPPWVSSSLALTSTSTTVSLIPDNADPSELAAGYRIRFSGTAPTAPSSWLAFLPGTTIGSGTVSLRSAENQTLDNFVWPGVLRSGSAFPLVFELSRYPTQSLAAFTAPRAAAIDLRYSSIGPPGLGPYGSLHGRGVITITFDRNGVFDQIMQSGTSLSPPQPITPTAPLFLLVATTESIQQNTSLWANESRWITLAPGTGRAHVSPNVVVTGTTSGDVMAARTLARQGVSGGGR